MTLIFPFAIVYTNGCPIDSVFGSGINYDTSSYVMVYAVWLDSAFWYAIVYPLIMPMPSTMASYRLSSSPYKIAPAYTKYIYDLL